jgi:hypothetical protein
MHNQYGTVPIWNGPDNTLPIRVGMRKCTAGLPSLNAVQARSRSVCDLISLIWSVLRNRILFSLRVILLDKCPHLSVLRSQPD